MFGSKRHFGEKSKKPARDSFFSRATCRYAPVRRIMSDNIERTVFRQIVSSVMKKTLSYVVLAVCMFPVMPMKVSAQNAQDALEDASGTSLTAQQWARRVEEARVRSEEFVTNARTRMADPVQLDQEEVNVADQRAMNDPSLMPGDIVS